MLIHLSRSCATSIQLSSAPEEPSAKTWSVTFQRCLPRRRCPRLKRNVPQSASLAARPADFHHCPAIAASRASMLRADSMVRFTNCSQSSSSAEYQTGGHGVGLKLWRFRVLPRSHPKASFPLFVASHKPPNTAKPKVTPTTFGRAQEHNVHVFHLFNMCMFSRMC